MSGDDGGYLYVFMHLPKTGGTTINAHFIEHLGFDERFAHLDPLGNQAREELGLPQPEDWPPRKLKRLDVISGHRVHATTHWMVEGKPARYFTFLRDPAALAVSRYNHEASRVEDPPGFWNWYRDEPANFQAGWCRHRLGVATYDEIVAALDGFWFVGVTETLDEDLPRIFATIGIPTESKNRRVTGGGADLADLGPLMRDVPIVKHQELTDEIRERVTERDAEDVRLHSYARRRRDTHDWGA